MTTYINLLIYLFIPCLLFGTELPDIHIQSYTENITVYGIDKGFSREVTICGTALKNTKYVPVSYDLENDLFSHFELAYKKNKKYKKARNVEVLSVPNSHHFHSSQSLKILEIDSGKVFRCTFSIRCKNLMLLSATNLFSYYKTDTSTYLISVPHDLHLVSDSLHLDSLAYCAVTNYSDQNYRYLKVVAQPLKIDDEHEFYDLPLLRHLVVPKDKVGKEMSYFNHWYRSSIDSISQLNETSKQIIDSIANSNPACTDFVSLYFDYITKGFKYLDVQVGMGAYIPHNVNQILQNKHGDCKDLSLLLCRMLQYKGYDANLALAATNGYFCDFNFPSLRSGNHAICSVFKDSILYLLDPTDINHKISPTVESLQGKTIFVTSEESPYYYKVPVVQSDKNRYDIKLNLTCDNSLLQGNFKLLATGSLSKNIRLVAKRNNDKILRQVVEYQIEEIFQSQHVNVLAYDVYADSVVIRGDIKYYNKFQSVRDVGYLFVDELPNLYMNAMHRTSIEDKTLIGTAFEKNVEVQISFSKAFYKFDFTPLSIKDNDFSLDFFAAEMGGHSLLIGYNYRVDDIWVDASNIKNVNDLIDNFNKKKNEAVILYF